MFFLNDFMLWMISIGKFRFVRFILGYFLDEEICIFFFLVILVSQGFIRVLRIFHDFVSIKIKIFPGFVMCLMILD